MPVKRQEDEDWCRLLMELSHLNALEAKVEAERRAWEIKGRDIAHAEQMIRDARARRLVQLSELAPAMFPAGKGRVGAVVEVVVWLEPAGGDVH